VVTPIACALRRHHVVLVLLAVVAAVAAPRAQSREGVSPLPSHLCTALSYIPWSSRLSFFCSWPAMDDLALIPIPATATFSSERPPSGVYFVRVRAMSAQGVGASSSEVMLRIP
jgi:hypothetical protein